eukprot:11208024-Lingulodinium_polyedra.AAC.1
MLEMVIHKIYAYYSTIIPKNWNTKQMQQAVVCVVTGLYGFRQPFVGAAAHSEQSEPRRYYHAVGELEEDVTTRSPLFIGL